MTEEKTQESNQKKKKILLIIVPLLLLLIISIILFLRVRESNVKNDLKISGIQVVQGEEETSNYEGEMTKIVGDNNNYINSNNPYLYLINDKDNTVFLQFNVYVGEKELYTSDLIGPGMMEKLDIYSMLPPGNYEINYIIDSYDLNDSSVELLSGVKQIKNITIS